MTDSEASMSDLSVRSVGERVDVVAADASELVLLARTARGSMAHGLLPPGATSKAIVHRTVDELWFVVSGAAEIWRANDEAETVVTVEAGASIAIPQGTRFQYRAAEDEPFRFIMATIPAWPGDDEAVFVSGFWAVSPS